MDTSRTTAILAAVRQQLELRRSMLDRADDLGEIVITVRLMAGTTDVRSTTISEQHVHRQVGR